MRPVFPLLFILICAGIVPASALDVAAHKDRLFAYPSVIETRDGGAFRIIDYNEMRDINGRDEIPEKRVKGQYVTPGVKRVEKDTRVDTAAGTINHVAVGTQQGAKVITVYIHGQGGNRKQGSNDYTFGGNFNRIKALMAGNGGLYLAPDVDDFGPTGVARMAALIDHYARMSPGAPVFVACGSAGGAVCYGLANAKATVRWLSGIMLMGSFWQDDFLASPAFERRVPLFIGHGSRDPVFAIGNMEGFYQRIRNADAAYPVMMVRFESGNHGTPIRMTDWRETLNWMLRNLPR